MTMGSLDRKTVTLLPRLLWMEERVDLTLYTITQWSLVHRNSSNHQDGVRMTVVMQRKVMNELMTTYLPSILLILITWATTFFKPYYFEAALSVNLTTMLVMTTIFISVMQMLPATAYVKMIDIWLIFGQLVPFAEVVLLTAMEYYREGDGSGEETTLMEERHVEEQPVSALATRLESSAQGTKTINHHGAPRVVQLGLYAEEGGAAPAALVTNMVQSTLEGESPHRPSLAPPTPGAQGLQHEEEARQQKMKYLKRIKYFGEYLIAYLALKVYISYICRGQSPSLHCGGCLPCLYSSSNYILFVICLNQRQLYFFVLMFHRGNIYYQHTRIPHNQTNENFW
jgi:hypothetical protein